LLLPANKQLGKDSLATREREETNVAPIAFCREENIGGGTPRGAD